MEQTNTILTLSPICRARLPDLIQCLWTTITLIIGPFRSVIYYMKKVLIIYRFLPQYRVDFYNGLREVLLRENIEFYLIYGKTNKIDALRNDEEDIEWARYIPNNVYKIGKIEILWQPCLKFLKDKDLVIVEGANRLLLNYYLMISRHFSKYKLGIWGHGRNLQINRNSLRNKFKSLFLKNCDWYFAYTDYVKRFLLEYNFPENRITVVQNAIETVYLKFYFRKLLKEELKKLKSELGIKSSMVGLYCGAMYQDKRLDFILEAINKIKKEIPNFHMIFVGDGIESFKISDVAEKNEWIHYVGSKFGVDRIKYFKISSVQIMPGAVGLGVLDSFALETPLITTANPFHGPEIEYLENGINGVITTDDISAYSKTVINILKTKQYLKLVEGCKLSAEKYTINNMVNNFRNGVLNCLNESKVF